MAGVTPLSTFGDSMKASSFRPATLCVHAGTYVDERTGGIGTPIFPSTSYKYPNAADENIYPRYFNVPNQKAVAQKVAALERGEQGLVFSSGMAAISTVLFAHLKPGDHAVFHGRTVCVRHIPLHQRRTRGFWNRDYPRRDARRVRGGNPANHAPGFRRIPFKSLVAVH